MPITRSAARAVPWLAAVVVVTGVGPLGTDTYLAAMPEMQRELGTSSAVVQLTLTAFIVGSALGQIGAGPVSDARGRRPVLLVGTVAFTVLSLLSAFAPTGPTLVAIRLVQGLVAGFGVAVGRACVSDVWHGPEAAQRFGTLASITFVAPVLAPALGGVVLAHGTWRLVFGGLALVGVLMVVAVLVGIPETLPPERRQAGGLAATGRRMADLATDAPFMRHVVVQCLATAGFFVYIGGSSFVLQHVYGISETTYSLVFASNAVAMVLVTVLFRLTVRRFGPARLRATGVAVAATAATALLVHALTAPGGGSFAPTWVLLSVVTGAMGLSIPGTQALAQEAGARSAGTASALQGGLAFLVGAGSTPLTGLVGDRSLVPMAALMCGLLLTSLVVLRVWRPVRQPEAVAAP
ncbi:multidrug effflux MFS transporter [Angustibacter aerolatus]